VVAVCEWNTSIGTVIGQTVVWPDAACLLRSDTSQAETRYLGRLSRGCYMISLRCSCVIGAEDGSRPGLAAHDRPVRVRLPGHIARG
jgi:hypothetical protein